MDFKKWLLFAALVLCGAFVMQPASAQQLGLDFNGYSFNIFGSMPLDINELPNTEIGAGFIYDGQHKGDHLRFVHGELMATGSFGVPGATASVGVRGFFADRDHFDGAGVAIGTRLSYYIPQYNRLGISGNIWYGPSVLTPGDYNHYLQYGVNVHYRVLRQASVYVGWRRIQLPIDGSRGSQFAHAPDNGWHIGLMVNF